MHNKYLLKIVHKLHFRFGMMDVRSFVKYTNTNNNHKSLSIFPQVCMEKCSPIILKLHLRAINYASNKIA